MLMPLGGCRHVSGLLMRRAWPLALMRSADRVPINSAGLMTPPHYRVFPILGHEPSFISFLHPSQSDDCSSTYAAAAIAELL